MSPLPHLALLWTTLWHSPSPARVHSLHVDLFPLTLSYSWLEYLILEKTGSTLHVPDMRFSSSLLTAVPGGTRTVPGSEQVTLVFL